MKVALITAAGSGMGAACAKTLAEQGWKVAVMSASGKGQALGESLGGLGLTGSVLDDAALKSAVDKTLDRFGRIDACVASSPHPPKPAIAGDLLSVTDDAWRQGLETVLIPVTRLARLLVPVMKQQGGGSFVNISTAWALEPDILFPVSAPMRAALASYAKLFANEYAADNIRMNNVLPGYIDSLPEKEERRAQIPMQRYGRVQEIAQTVSFLVGEGGGYITGQNIRVDGGLTKHV